VEKSLELLVLLLAALATGGLLVNWIGLARAMSRLSASAYVEVHQATNHTFDPYMPIVVIGAVAGGIVLAAMYGIHSVPGQLATAGAVGYALVIVIGVPACVRINYQVASWSVQNPPHGRGATRARWIRSHIIRTLCSIPAFATYVLAVMSSTGRP